MKLFVTPPRRPSGIQSQQPNKTFSKLQYRKKVGSFLIDILITGNRKESVYIYLGDTELAGNSDHRICKACGLYSEVFKILVCA